MNINMPISIIPRYFLTSCIKINSGNFKLMQFSQDTDTFVSMLDGGIDPNSSGEFSFIVLFYTMPC